MLDAFNRVFVSVLLALFLFANKVQSQSWNSVSVGGGGYVTGVFVHPNQSDLVYIRSDVAGAFRWNETAKVWIPLINFSNADAHHYSIESLALDPSDPDVVYIAAGAGYETWDGTGDVYRSADRGVTWQSCNLPVKFGGDRGYRWAGERLMVDPNNSNIVFAGTRNDGLFRSVNQGTSWDTVRTLPEKGDFGLGVMSIAIDPGLKTSTGASAVVYVGLVSGSQGKIMRTSDGGETWSDIMSLTNAPDRSYFPMRALVAADGTLFCTLNTSEWPGTGKVFRYSHGTSPAWKEITPAAGKPYSAISVDTSKTSPRVLVATFEYRVGKIFLSETAGDTWTNLPQNKNFTVPWWPQDQWFNSYSSNVAFDPHHPGRAWLTDWFGIWRTDNVDDGNWTTYVQGYEATVGLAMASPPAGQAVLFSGFADIQGFRHTDLSTYPTKAIAIARHPIQDVTSISVNEANPQYVYIAADARNWSEDSCGAYSNDNGVTFTNFPSSPFKGARAGRIRVSAADTNLLIWTPVKSKPYRSANRGQSWTRIDDLADSSFMWTWEYHDPLEADKVESGTFYFHDFRTAIFKASVDSGKTWTTTKTFSSHRNDKEFAVKSVPGRAGEVWISFRWDGLYRSRNRGNDFEKLPNVQFVIKFGFGKGLSDTIPAAYFLGSIDNVYGVYRSYDLGQSWTMISTMDHPIGRRPYFLEGDRRILGRVYVNTGGRGILYLDSEMENPTRLGVNRPRTTAGFRSNRIADDYQLYSIHGKRLDIKNREAGVRFTGATGLVVIKKTVQAEMD